MKNIKVVVYSIIALICLALTYFVHWLWIVPVAFIIFVNQRELMGRG